VITLVVSATKAEAQHVPDGLPLLITGIGKTAAASGVARALARRPEITEVVNIGSCGALRDGLAGVFEIGRVLNHDLSAEALRLIGYEPEIELEVGRGEYVLATGDVFVHETDVRARLARQAHLVDMEGFAIAWACREAGVPVRLVKHVSDDANEQSLDWKTLVEQSSTALGEWLSEHVGAR